MIVDGYEIRQEFDTRDIGPHMDIYGYRDGKFAFLTNVEGCRELSENEIRELIEVLKELGPLKTA